MLMGIGMALGNVSFVTSGDAGTPGNSAQILLREFSRDRTLFDGGLARGARGADIPLSGTVSGALEGAGVWAEVVDAATGAVLLPAREIARVAGGFWEGVYPEVPCSPLWLRPQVWIEGSTASKATTANRFGVGLIYVVSGQSNEWRWVSGNNDGTGVFDRISDDDAVQLIYLDNRGGVGGSDEAAAIVGPLPVTNATPRSEGVAATASIFCNHAPGLKVLLVVDAKSGEGQNNTLNDNSITRMFSSVQGLFDRVRSDGAEPGLFLIMHPNGLPSNNLDRAAYYYEAFTGKDWVHDSRVTVPGPAGRDTGVTEFISHTWSDALPGILDGRTKLWCMEAGFMGIRTKTEIPTARAGEDAYSLLESRDPATFKSIGGSATSFRGDPPDFTADYIHHSGALEFGMKNHGKYLAAQVMIYLGLIPNIREQPKIDRITWREDKVILGWSGGNITTRAAKLAPGTHPTYRATGAMVSTFIDENGVPLVAMIEDDAGNRADTGVIAIYPNTPGFSGMSKIYYTPANESEGVSVLMVNNGPNFLPLADLGLDNYIGPELRRSGLGFQYINDANGLADPSGEIFTPIIDSEPKPGFTAKIVNANAFTFEWRVRNTMNEGLVLLGLGNNSDNYGNITLTATGVLNFNLENGAGDPIGPVSSNGISVFPANEMRTIRIAGDKAAHVIHVWVEDESGNMQPANVGSFGQVVWNGALPANNSHRIIKAMGFDTYGWSSGDFVYCKYWGAYIQPGSMSEVAPTYKVYSDGNGGFQTTDPAT